MAYIKTSWVARVGTALNRFLKTNETSTEVELTNDPTGVTTEGTPFTVANMNKIEQGIYDAHVTADANASNLLANVNQGVKTTDSPTFITLGFASLNPDNSTETTVQLSAGESQVLPKGAYAMSIDSQAVCQMKYGSDWVSIFISPGGFVISDGVNFRLRNTNTLETRTIKIRKW